MLKILLSLLLLCGAARAQVSMLISSQAATGGTPISLVGHAICQAEVDNGSNANCTTAPIDCHLANFVHVSVTNGGTSIISVETISDSSGNTPYLHGTEQTYSTYNSLNQYWFENPMVSSSMTFTITGAAAVLPIISASCWANVATSSVKDQEAVAMDMATTLSTGPLTPLSPNELIITSFSAAPPTLGTQSQLAPTGFTALDARDGVSANSVGLHTAYQIQTTATPVTPVWDSASNVTTLRVLGQAISFK